MNLYSYKRLYNVNVRLFIKNKRIYFIIRIHLFNYNTTLNAWIK